MDKSRAAAAGKAPTMTADSEPKIPQIDPTLNVKEKLQDIFRGLVTKADADMAFNAMARDKDAKRQDDLRAADMAYNAMAREKDAERQDDAIQHVTAMATQKAASDEAKATTLRLQVETLAAGVNQRVSELERNRSENQGRGTGGAAVMAYVVTFISVAIAIASISLALFRH
jgi:FKBP-type peptidyl-prolyl cis-trans isomerase